MDKRIDCNHRKKQPAVNTKYPCTALMNRKSEREKKRELQKKIDFEQMNLRS